MNASVLYKDFGSDLLEHGSTSTVSSDELEDEKLQAFENGYQAGWDDAIKAQTNLDLSISSALATNLQEASFQYHEMRGQMTRRVREIVQGIIDAVLPDMAQQSLGGHIVQLIEGHTRTSLEQQVRLRVPVNAVQHIERLLPETPIEYELVGDPSLSPDQAFLDLGDSHHAIDLGRVIKDVQTAVSDYFETQDSEEKND